MIRPATHGDAVACAEIYAPYVTDSVISFESEAPSAAEMQRRMRGAHLWLVAEAAGEVCGYAYGTSHREREAYRWAADVAIYIAAAHHGRGVGRSLYRALIDGLREQGVCVACAGVALPNSASEALHCALGFSEVGTYRRIGYKHGRWTDCRWYQLDLRPSDQPPPPGASLRMPAEARTEALLDELEHILCNNADRRLAAARAADAIRAGTGWRWVGIYTVDGGSVLNEAWSGPQAPAFPVFPATSGLTASAIANRQIVYSPEVARDPRYLTNHDTTGSELIAPILFEGRVVGTLDIESDCPSAFGTADRRLAEHLTARLAGLWSTSV